MIRLSQNDISGLLLGITQKLDISDSLYIAAEQKYKAVGEWLSGDNSPFAILSPTIYPQGSFQFGTIVKPLTDTDDYDLDIVFEVMLSKDEITQEALKNSVGKRLKDHGIYKNLLDKEGRRCWTLQYADSARFHMDILPAIPGEDVIPLLLSMNVPESLAKTSISITDKTLSNYSRINLQWPLSNPKGYSAWFRNRMLIQFENLRRIIATERKSSLGEVPEYTIKTPLQRCIQLLKRHRDIQFAEELEIKPASIIITTLAANAYNNEADLLKALVSITDKMPNYIINRNGVSWVSNPTDPRENFADRWQEDPQKLPAFKNWHQQFKTEIGDLLNCEDLDEAKEKLILMFGENVSENVIDEFKSSHKEHNQKGQIGIISSHPTVEIQDPMKPWGEELY
ncbi:nucleotidyltransferase domain-containing protein [Pelolinea submarina]|uniref:Cyclic GMP-AMP synthase n=1 Tax=Pelolinea submarina TaxID=913107 RepID=A0A347ZQ29_9CHLR|nr:nucleotidyltransferase [Pelolinea submarina]REG06261.1 hypothetical protein DFR64_2693 [Pelolinea submarina]BBB47410.1 hypothetical protein Pelsub_P0637 [Pelolinea submarina]